MPDIEQIKRNVLKMAATGLPQADIDDYIANAGLAPHELGALRVEQPSLLGGMGRAVARGAIGIGPYLDEMDAATNATLAPVVDPYLPDGYHKLHGAAWGERYDQALDMQREQDRAFDAAHPYASFGARMVGGVTSSLAFGRAMPSATPFIFGTLPKIAGAPQQTAGQQALAAAKASAIAGGAIGGVEGFGQGEGGFENRSLSAGVGGTVGAGVGAVLPGVGSAIGSAYHKGQQLFGWATEGGRQRMAGERIAGAASDPAALPDALGGASQPLVPGSRPTTFQQSGDEGLGALEREMQAKYPAPFEQRRTEQDAARLGAVAGLQETGAPEAVSAAIRKRLRTIDAEALEEFEQAKRLAQSLGDSIGVPMSPEESGDLIRGNLRSLRKRALEREEELWDAVDPDGTLLLRPERISATAREIATDLPGSARLTSPQEAEIFRSMEGYGDAVPFREVSRMRSRLSQAIDDERGRNGKSPAWARLVQLRGAVETDLENALTRKVVADEEAVSAGQKLAENTTSAALEREAKRWLAEQRDVTDGRAGRRVVEKGVSDTLGLQSTNGAVGSAERLTADDILEKDANDPFFIRSRDGQPFVPRELGNPDLGSAPSFDGSSELPIRVRRKELKAHLTNGAHRADAEILGYSDPWAMLNDIVLNYDSIRLPKGDRGNRIVLTKLDPGDVNGVTVVELSKVDGADYWRVVTAGRRKLDGLGQEIGVRKRTPDVSSGKATAIVNRPPQSRQETEFAQGPTENRYAPQSDGRQGLNAFDPAFMERFQAATDATRERANVFDNRQLGPILEPGSSSPFKLESAKVPARVFTPGPGGYERVQTFRQAGTTPEDMAAVEAYAIGRLRNATMGKDGLIDPMLLESWRQAHADALRAFPELDARIADAGGAAKAVVQSAQARKAAIEAEQKGAFGRLIGIHAPEDVTRVVGGLFDRRDGALQLGALRQRVADDPAAVEGLRKAAADHLAARLIAVTDAAGRSPSAQGAFQTFVKNNRAALNTVFSGDEINVLEAVADDLERASRSARTGVSGRAGALEEPGSVLQTVVTAATGQGASATGGLGRLIDAMRQNGIASTDGLVRDAMLDPMRARLLLTKVPADRERADAMFQDLARRYIRAAVLASETGPGDRRRHDPAPPVPASEGRAPASGAPYVDAMIASQAKLLAQLPLFRALAERGGW